MTVRKAIKRKTAKAAHTAMQRHIEKMIAKGWALNTQFAGDAFLHYEVIAYFNKA